jgi:hypothetical protein
MSERPLSVVAVGAAGAIGRVHARVACEDPDLEVVGSDPPDPQSVTRGSIATSSRRSERIANPE